MKFKAVRERSSLKEGRNRKIRKRNIKFGRKKKKKENQKWTKFRKVRGWKQ